MVDLLGNIADRGSWVYLSVWVDAHRVHILKPVSDHSFWTPIKKGKSENFVSDELRHQTFRRRNRTNKRRRLLMWTTSLKRWAFTRDSKRLSTEQKRRLLTAIAPETLGGELSDPRLVFQHGRNPHGCGLHEARKDLAALDL